MQPRRDGHSGRASLDVAKKNNNKEIQSFFFFFPPPPKLCVSFSPPWGRTTAWAVRKVVFAVGFLGVTYLLLLFLFFFSFFFKNNRSMLQENDQKHTRVYAECNSIFHSRGPGVLHSARGPCITIISKAWDSAFIGYRHSYELFVVFYMEIFLSMDRACISWLSNYPDRANTWPRRSHWSAIQWTCDYIKPQLTINFFSSSTSANQKLPKIYAGMYVTLLNPFACF